MYYMCSYVCFWIPVFLHSEYSGFLCDIRHSLIKNIPRTGPSSCVSMPIEHHYVIYHQRKAVGCSDIVYDPGRSQ